MGQCECHNTPSICSHAPTQHPPVILPGQVPREDFAFARVENGLQRLPVFWMHPLDQWFRDQILVGQSILIGKCLVDSRSLAGYGGPKQHGVFREG